MKTLFANCNLLDGTKNMTVQPNMNVIVENGKIIEITKEIGDFDGKIVNLNGKFLLPGLINMHVHLPGSGKPKKKSTDASKAAALATSNWLLRKITTQMCVNYAKDELFSGVTTIRTVGGLTDYDTTIRNRINAGKIDGPRILASNMGVSVPGGHMAGSVAQPVTSPEEAREWVKKSLAQGVDLIKIMVTGGVLDAKVKGEPGAVKMSDEIIKACCEEAHKAGKKVAAHVESPAGVKNALINGVDSIEHGADVDDETIELFKKYGACDICTVSPAISLSKFDNSLTGADDVVLFNANIVYNGIVQNAKKAIANGIDVGLGTDTACPYSTHYDMWRELVYFNKLVGADPVFTLYTATLKNAELAGIEKETGSIEVNKSADFIICEKNPLEDFRNLRNLNMVVKCGKIYTKKPRKIPVCEKHLDEFLATLY